MAEKIAALMERLQGDEWRTRKGFSPEIQAVIDTTLGSSTQKDIESAFTGWIRAHQPCLFGRIAAKQKAITYCLISEEMLCSDEIELRNHIQNDPPPLDGVRV